MLADLLTEPRRAPGRDDGWRRRAINVPLATVASGQSWCPTVNDTSRSGGTTASKYAPYKRGVAGSKPAAPTQVRGLSGLIICFRRVAWERKWELDSYRAPGRRPRLVEAAAADSSGSRRSRGL